MHMQIYTQEGTSKSSWSDEINSMRLSCCKKLLKPTCSFFIIHIFYILQKQIHIRHSLVTHDGILHSFAPHFLPISYQPIHIYTLDSLYSC